MRYKGLKGKFWSTFSEYIRKRDFIKYRKCITCGKNFHSWKDSQAGHFAPAGNCGFALLFSEDNVHAECSYDNAFNSGHLIQYRANLLSRYGKNFVSNLEEKYNQSRYKGVTTKEWNKNEYLEKILQYKIKIAKLNDSLSSFD